MRGYSQSECAFVRGSSRATKVDTFLIYIFQFLFIQQNLIIIYMHAVGITDLVAVELTRSVYVRVRTYTCGIPDECIV